MDSVRLLCQWLSTLVTAHADVESQLRVCLTVRVLVLSVPETPPCPASLVCPVLWHRGSCWLFEAYSALTSAC